MDKFELVMAASLLGLAIAIGFMAAAVFLLALSEFIR